MGKQNVAVIGLGRVGSDFLAALRSRHDLGIQIVCVSELNDTEGKKDALSAGMVMKTTEEIVALGSGIDMIFDLTGNASVRRGLRDALAQTNNFHTVIAPENMAHLIWSLLTDKALPEVHSHMGY